MRVAFYPVLAGERRQPIGRRSIAFLLTLAAHILLGLLLFLLTPELHKPPLPKVFEMLSISPSKPAPKAAVKATSAAAAKPRAKPKPVTPHPRMTSPAPPKLFGTELFDAIDIAKLPNHRAEIAAASGIDGSSAGAGVGKDSEAAYGSGGGPNGETLYKAEWQREPTHAELAGYLPNGAPQNSWGVIACRTVAQFRVEDCRELGDSPPGSGLARAIRQAAWQFRVLPPRINGHPQIGAWVSIRISFSEAAGG